MDIKFQQRSDYTFKYNKQLGRHGMATFDTRLFGQAC